MDKLELTLTKSNFMLWDWCSYKYKRVAIDKERQPATPEMFAGIKKHTAHDECIAAIVLDEVVQLELKDKIAYVRSKLPEEEDVIYDSMAKHEAMKLELMTDNLDLFKPKIVEKTYTKLLIDRDDVALTIKGRPDHIYMEDDGYYNIMELKSGKWNPTYMTSKIRKELVFYYLLLDGQLDADIKYISWFFPKEDHFDSEVIKKRTVTAVMKNLEKIIEAHQTMDFSAQYYDKKCGSCHLLSECIFK